MSIPWQQVILLASLGFLLLLRCLEGISLPPLVHDLSRLYLLPGLMTSRADDVTILFRNQARMNMTMTSRHNNIDEEEEVVEEEVARDVCGVAAGQAILLPNGSLTTTADNLGIIFKCTADVHVFAIFHANNRVASVIDLTSVSSSMNCRGFFIPSFNLTNATYTLLLSSLNDGTRVTISSNAAYQVNGLTIAKNGELTLGALETITLKGQLAKTMRIDSDDVVVAILQVETAGGITWIEQLQCYSSWEKRYYIPQVPIVGVQSFITLTARDDFTKVTVSDKHVYELQSQQSLQIPMTKPVIVNSSKPILIRQFAFVRNKAQFLWTIPPAQFVYTTLRLPNFTDIFHGRDSKVVVIVLNSTEVNWNGSNCIKFADSQRQTCSITNQFSLHNGPLQAFVIARIGSDITSVCLRWPDDIHRPVEGNMIISKSLLGRIPVIGARTLGDTISGALRQPPKDNGAAAALEQDTPAPVIYSSDSDTSSKIPRSFYIAIIASLASAVLLVIICIVSFALAECGCPAAIRNSRIIPFSS